MKSVVVKYYSHRNLGDDLLVKVLTDRYRNQFVLNSYNRAPFKDSKNVSLAGGQIRRLYNHLANRIKPRASFLKLAEKADLMIYVGGSIFIESGNLAVWYQNLDMYRQLQLKNKPYYIIGSNFGPYQSPEFLDICQEIVAGAEDVCFRDQDSYRLFSNLPNTRIATDIIFSLDSNCYQSKIQKRAIVSVIDPSWRFSAAQSKHYFQLVVDLIQQAVKNGYQAILMSFCQPEGDEKAVKKIYNLLDKKTQQSVNFYFYRNNLEEALQLIASSEIVIGTRLHAVILGLVFGKKVLPLIYSDKVYNLLDDINFTNLSIDIRDTVKQSPRDFDLNTLFIPSFDPQAKLAEHQFQELDKILSLRSQKTK